MMTGSLLAPAEGLEPAKLDEAGLTLAPYASQADASRGRMVAEAPSATRSLFQRDRDRIVHSAAFRRLALKTQVFMADEGDHYRTRLTHTIEVAQIARSIARTLKLDEDLTEALALAHDLGHPPFGHTGEDALDACVRPAGGFEHNAHTLRIVTALECCYPDFDGLNLTWETLEGLVKRNGPLVDGTGPSGSRDVPAGILALDAGIALDLDLYASAEAQVASVADDIAYNAHDLQDGLEAGLFALDDLRSVPILQVILAAIGQDCPHLGVSRTTFELSRRTIGWFVEDVLAASRLRLGEAAPEDTAALRRLGYPAVALSEAGASASRDIKRFLFARMYRHPRLIRVRGQAAEIVTDLALHFIAHPEIVPRSQKPLDALCGAMPPLTGSVQDATMRAVADHVAGMTDRSAVAWHRRLFATTPDLR